MRSNVFLYCQSIFAVTAFYISPYPSDISTLVIFLILSLVWLCHSYLIFKKIDDSFRTQYFIKSGHMTLSFLSFGILVMAFVIGVVAMLFLTAITGIDYTEIYRFFYPLNMVIALLIGTMFRIKDVVRLTSRNSVFYWQTVGNERKADGAGENGASGDSYDGEFDSSQFNTYSETEKMLTILGLGPDATEASLKSRYHILAKIYHPDRMAELSEKEKAAALEEFKRIQHAYRAVKQAMARGQI